MTDRREASAPDVAWYGRLTAVSLGVIVSAAALHLSGSEAFRPYFGDLDPVFVTTLVALVGTLGLVLLEKGGWFRVRRPGGRPSGLAMAAGIATVFVVPAIALDLLVVFPVDTNVAWPRAFLFYPTIGYVVEVAFHVLPLAALLPLLGRAVGERHRSTLVWTCILLASLIEPTIQSVLGPSGFPRLATAYVALHVFLFNVCQLWVFERYDFVSMVALRLVYYAWWHILWGYVRLQLLF